MVYMLLAVYKNARVGKREGKYREMKKKRLDGEMQRYCYCLMRSEAGTR